MRNNIYEAFTILPSKIVAGLGWIIMLFAVLKPDKLEELLDSFINSEQIQFWSIVFLIIFSLYWILVAFLKPTDKKVLPTRAKQTSHGDNSVNVSSGIYQTSYGDNSTNVAGNYNVNQLPPKFSEEQTVNTLPPHLGGKDRLNLGNIGSLLRLVPCNNEMVTMAVDAVPINYPDKVTPNMEVRNLNIMSGPLERIEFNNGVNKRHNIDVDGKVFVVTLIKTEVLEVKNVNNAVSYTFNIAER
ncbi:MAG: hypothetical protein P8H03_05100 [Emcibacteraceae bacterium]|nr:hypothetical protein [Emcibacteraceae bacterium]